MKPRILVIDDEGAIRDSLRMILEYEDYQFVGAASGQEGLALVQRERPDLVMLDIKMPTLDGISAARRIAAARIAPVVMLTAFSQRDLVEQARDAGALAYLVKPFSKSDLAPAIEIAVSRFAELGELEREVADLNERLASRRAVDRAKSILQQSLAIGHSD